LNIGGRDFFVNASTLTRNKGTLFEKLIISNKIDLSEEVFFDRSFKYFNYILQYLRTAKFNHSGLSKADLEELCIEAKFYEILGLADIIDELKKEIRFIAFFYNAPYVYSGITCGTNRIEDFNDNDTRSLSLGICANSPGWITFEINYENEIEDIEIGGYNGNTTYWGPTNGSGAKISTSIDNKNFIEVGTIPSSFGTLIVRVRLTKTKAKYIKFTHTSYLGLGYFKIFKN